jgi:DDE superfamily endonuclease
MNDFELLDLYTDYLVSAFGAVTSTGLSEMLDSAISHDRISRMLSRREFTQQDYWQAIKGIVRRVESPQGIIKVDDTIEEKPHSTENEIICWHYDHAKDRNVKGINIINFVYQPHPSSQTNFSLPVAFEVVEKTEQFLDTKSGKVKRRNSRGKTEIVRTRLRILQQLNKVAFRTVLWDSWYSSKENFEFAHLELKKTFIGAIKSNRKVALTLQDKKQGKFTKIEELQWHQVETRIVYMQGMDFPLLLTKQVFTNKDGSNGKLFLVSNDLNLTAPELFSTYGERWGIEVFHRSLKQNVGLEKSPTKYEVTQRNHIFAAMLAWIKLEILSFKDQSNHYGFKTKLYVKAIRAAFDELQTLKQVCKNLPNPELKPIPLLG